MEKDAQSVYQRVVEEIATKKKAYLSIRHCAAEDLYKILDREASALFTLGAEHVYASSSQPGLPLKEGRLGSWRLSFCHEMVDLFRSLTKNRIPPGNRLTLEPLSPGREEEWVTVYNEGFYSVPNSRTYDKNAVEDEQSQGCLLGFVSFNGETAGVYELNLEGDCPEIAGIALREAFRGRGLGRELLLCVMEQLAQQGYERCKLLVSTANVPAMALYRSVGFGGDVLRGRWYEVTPHG